MHRTESEYHRAVSQPTYELIAHEFSSWQTDIRERSENGFGGGDYVHARKITVVASTVGQDIFTRGQGIIVTSETTKSVDVARSFLY
jgi:hypothetical protein